MQRKIRMVNNTHNKSMFVYSSIFVTAFIVVAAPIVGSIPNAFATFLPFSLEEEPAQDGEEDGEVGLPPAENNTAVTNNVTSPPQTPETNLTTTPEPTEPEPQVPTPSQVPADEQNQTGSTGAVEAIRCPPFSPPANIVLKSGNPTLKTNTDSRNQFSTDGGINWSPAYIVSRQGAYHIITGTEYISYLPDAFGGAGNSTWYRTTFTLPSQFTNSLLNITIHADNAATIYLNSPTTQLASPIHKIGEQTIAEIPSNFQDLPESYITTNLSPGLNILYFNITNFTDYTAFDYLATVTYCTPSTIGPADPGPIPTDPIDNRTVPIPPTSVNVICPASNVQHWDKIVFSITQPGLAPSLGYPANSPLDIKVLDDPRTVADIKKKVLDFLRLPDNIDYRNAITIHDIEYAIVCAQVGSATGVGPAVNGTIGPPGIAEDSGAMVPGLPGNTTITEEGLTQPPPLESSAETQGEEMTGIGDLQQQLLQ